MSDGKDSRAETKAEAKKVETKVKDKVGEIKDEKKKKAPTEHKYVGKKLGKTGGKIASIEKITLSGREYNEVSLEDGTTYRLNDNDLDTQVK